MASEFHHRRKVGFIDTDRGGLIHYTNYFRYLEEAEVAFIGSLGLAPEDDPFQASSLPRISVSAEFLKPVGFGDELDIHIWVAAKGRSSITFKASFRCNGEEAARASVKAVCAEKAEDGTIRSRPLPEALDRALEVHEA